MKDRCPDLHFELAVATRLAAMCAESNNGPDHSLIKTLSMKLDTMTEALPVHIMHDAFGHFGASLAFSIIFANRQTRSLVIQPTTDH